MVPTPAVSKSDQRAIKNRWYYVGMAALFVWLFQLEWRKYGGPVLNFDTLGTWIGTPVFCWRAVQAWSLFLRPKNRP